MAKNAPRKNALGMNLDPESFEQHGENEEVKEEVKVETPEPVVEKVEEIPEAPVQEEVPNEEPSGSIDEVLSDIANPRNDKRRGYSLYLSESVMKEATKRAKSAGYKTAAPYIDEVLKRVFQL